MKININDDSNLKRVLLDYVNGLIEVYEKVGLKTTLAEIDLEILQGALKDLQDGGEVDFEIEITGHEEVDISLQSSKSLQEAIKEAKDEFVKANPFREEDLERNEVSIIALIGKDKYVVYDVDVYFLSLYPANLLYIPQRYNV